jgi:hypothetical protein
VRAFALAKPLAQAGSYAGAFSRARLASRISRVTALGKPLAAARNFTVAHRVALLLTCPPLSSRPASGLGDAMLRRFWHDALRAACATLLITGGAQCATAQTLEAEPGPVAGFPLAAPQVLAAGASRAVRAAP